MAIDKADVLDGIERLAGVAEKFGGAAEIIGEGLEFIAEVVRLSTPEPEGDPRAMLRRLKEHLRAIVAADLQKALDEDTP